MDDMNYPFGTSEDVEIEDKTSTSEFEGNKASDREVIDKKLRQFFDGKIVRKDLTKHIKEGANVPIYVLEYLLGQYCNSDDEEIINKGVETVKSILSNNYVRPDEAQKVLSQLRQNSLRNLAVWSFMMSTSHTLIWKIWQNIMYLYRSRVGVS